MSAIYEPASGTTTNPSPDISISLATLADDLGFLAGVNFVTILEPYVGTEEAVIKMRNGLVREIKEPVEDEQYSYAYKGYSSFIKGQANCKSKEE
jgi:hypothetical protein